MANEAILTQLGYVPNEALLAQLDRIVKNTHGFEKISKHIMDLNTALKVDGGYVALSNSEDCFKIKFENVCSECREGTLAKIDHFATKYKVKLERVEGKDTFYIRGFEK